MKPHILFVDDESNVLDGFKRMLRAERDRWEMSFVQSADAALDEAHLTPFDAIVLDVMMPGKDGFALLAELRNTQPTKDIPVIILTGALEAGLKRRALDLGATDLLNKPVAPEDLVARLRSVLRLKSYQDELKCQNEILERKVQERTAELAASRMDIIWRLGKAAEHRDEETGDHVVRVGCYCRLLAEALGMQRDFVDTIFLASPLHDIGKIGIPDSILLKRGTLTAEEQEIMRVHCVIGAEILRHDSQPKSALVARNLACSHTPVTPPENPILKMAASIAMTHHEWWDGTGYPAGLAGKAIPMESRIVALADVYDALGSERPYKPAYSEADVLQIIDDEAGRHFDPVVHRAFERCVEGFRSVRSELSDETACLAGQECAT